MNVQRALSVWILAFASSTFGPLAAVRAEVTAEAASQAVEPPASSAGQADPRLRELARELIRVQEQVRAVELERESIPLLGVDLGRQAAWASTGVLWIGALVAFSTAQSIDDELHGGDHLPGNDSDGDGDVDSRDEAHSRRIARAMLGTSALPFALGLFSSVHYRKNV